MIINFFISIISIIIIVTSYFLLKKQRINDYRNDLFAIRHNLFMLAAQNEIGFDSEAYRFLEKKINGSIRFAHKINYPFLLFSIFVFKHKKISFEKNRQEEERILNSLNNQNLRKKIDEINNQLSSALFRYLFKNSWLFKLNIISIFCKNAMQNPDIKTQVKDKKLQNIWDTLAFDNLQLESGYNFAH